MKLLLLPALVLAALPFVTQDDDEPKPAPEVGKPAPTIRLNDHEGRATAIGGESDTWTVLAFYPKALTPG